MICFVALFLCTLLPATLSHATHHSSNVTVIDVTNETSYLTTTEDDRLVVLFRYESAVLLGGRNVIYNISLRDLKPLQKYKWSTTEKDRRECEKILSSDCDNFIRTFYTDGPQFVACGTHGLHPTCALFDYGHEDPRSLLPGEGLSPFQANVRAPFLHINTSLFTLNAPEFSSASEAMWIRNETRAAVRANGNTRRGPMRTALGETAFDGALFVAMEQNQQEVLTFFTELPLDDEGCGLRRVSRVGRVCIDDPGSSRNRDEWSSFVKARLECGISEGGHDTLHFDQLSSIASSSRHFFGSFRSQLAGLGGSAVCVIARDEISSRLSANFKWRGGRCPRATSPDEQSALRSSPLVKNKVVSSPTFVHYGEDHFTAMTVQENVADMLGGTYTILFLGTNRGRIFKIVVDSHGEATHVVTLESQKSSTPSEILSMWMYRQPIPNQQSKTWIMALTNNTLLRIPSSGCSASPGCGECLSVRDPSCAWILHGAECVPVEPNLHRRKYLTQQTEKCPKRRTEPVLPPPPRPLPCLCEKREPCSTQVIQKEIETTPNIAWVSLPAMFVFAIGLATGALLNCLITKRRTITGKTNKVPCRIDAFSSPRTSVSRPISGSMHSSIQTYC